MGPLDFVGNREALTKIWGEKDPRGPTENNLQLNHQSKPPIHGSNDSPWSALVFHWVCFGLWVD